MKISRLQEGHINLTWKLDTDKGSYIIQKLLQGNIKAIEHNYSLLLNFDNIPKWIMPRFMSGKEVLQWIRNFEGDTFDGQQEYAGLVKYIEKDNSSLCWRIYSFIEGATGESLSECNPEEYGKLLGELHYRFKEIRGRIAENGKLGFEQALEHFHNTIWYLGQYRIAYKEYKEKSKTPANESITNSQIDTTLDALNCKIEAYANNHKLNLFEDDNSIIHGDARIANVVFTKDRAYFIDMDTVMLGSPLVDIADMIRSIISHTEKDDFSVIEEFMKAYNKANPLEKSYTIKEVQTVLSLIRFELTIRYLTDYLTGAGYFKEEYPGQSLDKAKTYLDACL